MTAITDLDRFADALSTGDLRVIGAADRALMRGALKITRTARDEAPKARSALTRSIYPRREALASVVVEARDEKARYVEDGSEKGGWPNILDLMEWIKARRIESDLPLERLAHAIRRNIYRNGTPAQPFMGPALEEHEDAIFADVRRSALAGLLEAMP